MAGYTHINLAAAEDSAPKFGLQDTLEARFVREPLGLEQSGLSFQRVKPGMRSAFGHKHKGQEEIYVVVAGGGRIKIDDDTLDLKPLDAVRVSADAVRAFEAGPDGLEVLAFGPRTDPDAAEAEMLPDWWDAE